MGQDNVQQKGCMQMGMALFGVFFALVYLLNFTAGLIELPDNLPIVGNIDEAVASAILFACLRYLGIDVLPFGKKGPGKPDEKLPKGEQKLLP